MSTPSIRARCLDELRISDEIEGWQPKLDSAAPQLDRQIGADAGRLAQRQSQREGDGLAHLLFLYSIIADLRTSSRYFLDSDSKRFVKICSRISRFSGDSVELSFLPQTANICSPCAVDFRCSQVAELNVAKHVP